MAVPLLYNSVMADTPYQDRKAGLSRERRQRWRGDKPRFVTKLYPELAERICERIAAGATLDEACAVPGSPHPTTFRRWAMEDRRLGDLYRKAARLASVAHRDRAAILARQLEAGEVPHGRIMATKAAVRSYMQLARA